MIAAITPRLLASVGWVTYLVYAGFCGLTLVWVQFGVPETRGVKLGREMDEVFGSFEGEPEEDLGVSETTALLGKDGGMSRRRGSLGAYT